MHAFTTRNQCKKKIVKNNMQFSSYAGCHFSNHKKEEDMCLVFRKLPCPDVFLIEMVDWLVLYPPTEVLTVIS